MKTYKLRDLVSEVITGEWGEEVSEQSNGINVKVIRSTNFTNTGELNLDKEVVMRSIDKSRVAKKKLLIGDIIIEKSGGSIEQPVGRVVFFESTDLFLCSNFTSIIRPNREIVVPKYLLYLLLHLYRNKKVIKFQNKTTGIINLKLEEYLKSIYVSVPSKDLQQEIVNKLDNIFFLIKNRKSQILLLDDLIKNVFFDMFGDPFDKKSRFPKLPLKDFGEIITGNTPPRKNPDNYGDYIEWIKSDNINTPNHYLTTAEESLSEKGSRIGRVVPENSVLVTCIAGSKSAIGNAAISTKSVAFNQQINAIIPYKESVNIHYLYAHFLVGKKLIQDASTNGMKGLVSKSTFQSIEFLNPPKELQDAFGIKFDKIQYLRGIYKESLSKLDSLYDSIFNNSFD